MSVRLPEQDEFLDHQLFEEFVIPCEVPAIVRDELGWCDGNPAEWIAYRTVPCSCGIIVRLVCTQCKEEYIRRMALHSFFECPTCGEETKGFNRFEPLRQGS